MEAVWLTSQRGGKLLQDSQQYQYSKLREGKYAIFRCVKYYSMKCSALAYVDMTKNIIVKTTGSHLSHTTELHN
jgi:hypothetical protein